MMTFPFFRGMLVVALVAGVAACSKQRTAANPAAAPLPVLGLAPAWKLQDANGNAVSSEQFKGRVVVLDFWATWCGPCRSEIPGYVDLVAKYGKDRLSVVGVSLDQTVLAGDDRFGAKLPGFADQAESSGGVGSFGGVAWAAAGGNAVGEKFGVKLPGYADLAKPAGLPGHPTVGRLVLQDGPALVRAFVHRFGVNYTMVMGDEEIVAAFGNVDILPTTFLIDRAGQVRDRKLGAEPPEDYARKVASLLN